MSQAESSCVFSWWTMRHQWWQGRAFGETCWVKWTTEAAILLKSISVSQMLSIWWYFKAISKDALNQQQEILNYCSICTDDPDRNVNTEVPSVVHEFLKNKIQKLQRRHKSTLFGQVQFFSYSFWAPHRTPTPKIQIKYPTNITH